MMVVIAMANDTATGMAIITGIATEIVTTTDKAIATRSSKVGSKVSRMGNSKGNSKGRSKILPRSRRRLSAQASWKSFQTPTAACANSRMA
jgi:hypothetical protein